MRGSGCVEVGEEEMRRGREGGDHRPHNGRW